MEIQEILNALEFNRGGFPREAVEAAIEQREAIVPHLMQSIEHAYQNAEHLDDDARETGEYMGHLYAMYLLAQFREKAAYPLIVKFFSLPGELSMDTTGDLAADDLKNILASVACGDTSLIKGMVVNQELNEWVRGAAVRSILCMVAAGEMPREEAIAYYAELFGGKLEREQSNAWDSLAVGAVDLRASELREEIDKAFAEHIVDPDFISPGEVEREIGRDKSEVPARLEKSGHGLVRSAIEEMESWECFREESPSAPNGDVLAPPAPPAKEVDAEPAALPPPAAEPVQPIRVERKPARNDPCPCGSGRKYKHCCAGKPTQGS